jgi:hypothetical protein
MAKQLKRMNAGGSSTGFNASTGRKMTPSMVGSGPVPAPRSGVDNSTTNTTSGQTRNFKKGGSVVAKKSTMTLARKRK